MDSPSAHVGGPLEGISVRPIAPYPFAPPFVAEKRKRSLSADDILTGSVPKSPRLAAGPASLAGAGAGAGDGRLNYFSRQHPSDLPLLSPEHALSSILPRLDEYAGVLDRNESLAINLGTRLLGPILMRRFERMFEAPPKIIGSGGGVKDGQSHPVSWIEVIEFARSKPDEFTLVSAADGTRVCLLQVGQYRVQISEEDYYLIANSFPEKMVPSQPIPEDEEKELGAISSLNAALLTISKLTAQISSRANVLLMRLQSRKQGIFEGRRAASSEQVLTQSQSQQSMMSSFSLSQPFSPLPSRGSSEKGQLSFASDVVRQFQMLAPASDPPSRSAPPLSDRNILSSRIRGYRTGGGADFDGYPSFQSTGAADTIQGLDLTFPATIPLSRLTAPPQIQPQPTQPPVQEPQRLPQSSTSVPISATAFRPPKSRPNTSDTQPFRAAMISRAESLNRGEQIVPPCDRCRRLQMDCIKNLTACAGCTKKHAKCNWREVKASELVGGDSSFVAQSGTAVECLNDSVTDSILSGSSLVSAPPPSQGVHRHHSAIPVSHRNGHDSIHHRSEVERVTSTFPYASSVGLGTAFGSTVPVVGLPVSGSIADDAAGATALAVLSEFGINSMDKYTDPEVDVSRFRSNPVDVVGSDADANGGMPIPDDSNPLSHHLHPSNRPQQHVHHLLPVATAAAAHHVKLIHERLSGNDSDNSAGNNTNSNNSNNNNNASNSGANAARKDYGGSLPKPSRVHDPSSLLNHHHHPSHHHAQHTHSHGQPAGTVSVGSRRQSRQPRQDGPQSSVGQQKQQQQQQQTVGVEGGG